MQSLRNQELKTHHFSGHFNLWFQSLLAIKILIE